MNNNQTFNIKKRSLLDLINKESSIFGCFFAIFVICYGYELTNFNLSIDEEILVNGTNWVGIGRWALQFITVLFWPQPTTPFGPFILFGIFGSISIIILLNTFNIKKPIIVYLAIFPLFIAFPVWFTQVEFSSNIIGCGIALLLNCLATYFTKSLFLQNNPISKKIQYLLSILIIIAFTVGIYQSFIFLYIVLSIPVFLHLYIQNGGIYSYFRRIIGVLSIAAASFALSLLISNLVMRLFHIKLDQYAESFLKIDMLLNEPKNILDTTIIQINNIYGLYWSEFGFAEYIFLSIPFVGIILLSLSISSGKLIRNFVVIGSMIFIAIVPFWLNPFMGGEIPVRTFVAIPAVIWIFLFMPLIVSNSKKIELVIFIIGIIAFTQILYIQSSIQAKAWTIQQHDILLAESLYRKIAELNSVKENNSPIKLAFFGAKTPYGNPYPTVYSSTNGASFFEWDEGNDYRIISFMRLIGFNNLLPIDKDDCIRIIPEFSLMPSWPASGSVKLVGDTTIIKLSNGKPPIICRQK